MAAKITMDVGGVLLEVELNDSPAAQALAKALPLKFRMSRWGDEYYGSCGLKLGEDLSARELMEVGELAYWPPGNALCIFFGPTPASTDDRPRAASPVIPLGRLRGDLGKLRSLSSSVSAQLS